MSNNIIELPSPAKPKQTIEEFLETPHWTGDALCGACGHEWQAVAAVGDEDHLECPNCKRMWGSAKHAVMPPKSIWRCNCGESLFWLTPDGSMCRRCGIISNDWAD